MLVMADLVSSGNYFLELEAQKVARYEVAARK